MQWVGTQQGQEMNEVEMHDGKDTKNLCIKEAFLKRSLKLSLLVIFTPLINKEAKREYSLVRVVPGCFHCLATA